MAECKQAMSAKDFAKAKSLKADVADLKARAAAAAAAGEDDASKEERQQMEDDARALENAVADARTEVKRREGELALLPKTVQAFIEFLAAEEHAKRGAEAKAKQEAKERQVTDACAAMGRPMWSKWCLKSNNNNSNIAEGEVGTVVGVLHGQGKVEVKFGQVTECFAPDELVTPEAWQKREVVRFCALSSVFVSHYSLNFCRLFACILLVPLWHTRASLILAHCCVCVRGIGTGG